MRPAALLALCLLLLAAGQASAATYFVRTDGNDSCSGLSDAAGPGPGACAFATPQACADVLQCGDTCLVRAGTYTACPTHPAIGGGDSEIIFALDDLTCSESARTTLRGYGDGPAVLQAAGGCDYALMTSNVTHFTVGGTGEDEGFTIQGDFDHNRSASEAPGDPIRRGTITFIGGFAGENRFITLIGNRLSGTTFDVGDDPEVFFMQTNTGFAFEGHEIAYNTLNANRNAIFTTLSVASSDQCKGAGACDAVNPNPTRIHHNIITNAGGSGTNERTALGIIGCSDCEVHHNYLASGAPGALTARYGFYNRDNRRVRIYDNYIETHSDDSSLTSCIYFQDTDDNVTEDQWLYNNTCYGHMRAGFRLDTVDNGELRNNLFVGISAAQPIGFPLGASGPHVGTVVDHNAIYNAGTFSCPNNATCAGGDVTSDPLIEGAGAKPTPFFRLQAGSPAIDAGMSDPDAPGTDYDDQPRVGALDIGADEFGAASECGNGVREGSEPCDGADFGGLTCLDFGFSGGALACSGLCVLSTNGCTGATPPPDVQNLVRTDVAS